MTEDALTFIVGYQMGRSFDQKNEDKPVCRWGALKAPIQNERTGHDKDLLRSGKKSDLRRGGGYHDSAQALRGQ